MTRIFGYARVSAGDQHVAGHRLTDAITGRLDISALHGCVRYFQS